MLSPVLGGVHCTLLIFCCLACKAAIFLARSAAASAALIGAQQGRTRADLQGEHLYPCGQQNRLFMQQSPKACAHFIPLQMENCPLAAAESDCEAACIEFWQSVVASEDCD